MRKVVFVVPVGRRVSGSTLLRSWQLRQLAEPLLKAQGIESLVSVGAGFRDAVLVLSKGAMLASKPASILRLKKRGNVVCADPVDGIISDAALAACDLLIAASMTQLADLSRRFPRHRIAYVGHHVDVRIGGISPPRDRFRLGYFGELVNTRFEEDLADIVSFVQVDTSMAMEAPWIDRLSDFNAHYAIRAPRSHDGFKPFTKGFVAAHCGCPILVDAQDEEARRLLPSDYPYFVAASSADHVREAIGRMSDSFGGSEWCQALAAMRKLETASARDRVALQFFEAVFPEVARPARETSAIGSLARRIAGSGRTSARR
jgi:hypothetical protein